MSQSPTPIRRGADARDTEAFAKQIAANLLTQNDAPQPISPVPETKKPLIEMHGIRKSYYIGKPNPLMMRTGLNMLGVHSSEAVMIGDRMDTDIVTGIESGLDTVLVLSGVSTRETVKLFPYRPRLILNGVGDIPG